MRINMDDNHERTQENQIPKNFGSNFEKAISQEIIIRELW